MLFRDYGQIRCKVPTFQSDPIESVPPPVMRSKPLTVCRWGRFFILSTCIPDSDKKKKDVSIRMGFFNNTRVRLIHDGQMGIMDLESRDYKLKKQKIPEGRL